MTKITSLNLWEKISEKELNDYTFCKIIQRKFKHPRTQQTGDFIVTNYSDSVQILAITTNNEIIFVNQFRFGSEKMSLELPAGRLENYESPLEGAIRELREETGYVGENFQLITTIYPNPAIMTNKIHLIKCENCQKLYSTNFDQFEDIETVLLKKSEIQRFISLKKINNCITLSALVFM